MRAESLLRRVFSLRFLKFGTVGTSGTLVNTSVLYLAHEFLFNGVHTAEIRLNLALALAIFLATLNNFFWNRLWTWADRKRYSHLSLPAQFGQYSLACSLSIVLQIFFTNLLAPHFYYQIANLVAIGMTSVLNFLLNDIWTFGRTRLMASSNGASKIDDGTRSGSLH